MLNTGKKRKKVPSSTPPRKQRMVCLMSEEEVQIVNRYLERYQITNRLVGFVKPYLLLFTTTWRKIILPYSANMKCADNDGG